MEEPGKLFFENLKKKTSLENISSLTLSTAIVKANISVVLSRTSMMGDGARMARGRREWGRMEEMRARMEREAAWRAATSGQEVVRRGQFWLG